MDGVPVVELGQGLTITRLVHGLWQIADMEQDGRAGVNEEAAQQDLKEYSAAGVIMSLRLLTMFYRRLPRHVYIRHGRSLRER